MTDTPQQTPDPGRDQTPPVPPPPGPEQDQPESAAPAPSTTIGTGTSIALGCVAGTILLVLIGLLFLGLVMLLG